MRNFPSGFSLNCIEGEDPCNLLSAIRRLDTFGPIRKCLRKSKLIKTLLHFPRSFPNNSSYVIRGFGRHLCFPFHCQGQIAKHYSPRSARKSLQIGLPETRFGMLTRGKLNEACFRSSVRPAPNSQKKWGKDQLSCSKVQEI